MGGTDKKVDESWKEKVAGEKEETQSQKEENVSQKTPAAERAEFPPVQASFVTLVAELAMQASLFMGEIPDPNTKEPIEDLNRAKYLIDELGMLEEKTAGNLTPEESSALKNVLFELRMKYLKKAPKP